MPSLARQGRRLRARRTGWHLQIGDSTERGLPEEDVLAKRWLGRLPARHYTILGNHDVLHNKRTASQWAAAYGNESQSYVIDFPTLRIVAVGPDRDYPAERSGTLSDRTLEWLEARIRNAPEKTCWVACHWPLKHTVMGDSSRLYTSAMQSFHAKPAEVVLVFRRSAPGAPTFDLALELGAGETLTSPLLAGFALPLTPLFAG